MKLVTISWSTTPRMPGLRASDVGRINCDTPGALKDWRAIVRGTQLYLVSPPGWVADAQKKRDTAGPTTVFGPVPVAEVYLEWQVSNDAELKDILAGKITHETPPFGWMPTPLVTDKPFLEQIPPGQTGDA